MARKKSTKRMQKKVERAAQELSKTRGGRVVLVIAIILIVAVIAFGVYWFYFRGKSSQDAEQKSYPNVSDQDISIHFLELGNVYTGDCTYIKTDSCDILIDCGSRESSVPSVVDYLNHYVTDGTLEYVIVTHAHEDHYAGFAGNGTYQSLFEYYTCQTIIDFAGVTSGKETQSMYTRYQTALAKEVSEEHANHYTALQCVNETDGAHKSYDIGSSYTMQILDSYYYVNVDSSNENNNSVCTLFTNGTKNYLFTGDLEKNGEKYLLARNTLPKVDLYKAGHHGSKTSSCAEFMEVIQPKTVVVCCCAGSPEYTKTNSNQFPTQEFVTNVHSYTDEIYVTTLYTGDSTTSIDKTAFTHFNGNIVYMAKGDVYKVVCSASSTKLKDSEWFKQNRTWA